ncbi:MAG TPA: hypothetical protein VGQ09_21740 [Chitinophagaceae bacterium]|jgi:hypothetical protein|nr:hypothetical protein [Chitinophagaceae bacterium]
MEIDAQAIEELKKNCCAEKDDKPTVSWVTDRYEEERDMCIAKILYRFIIVVILIVLIAVVAIIFI